MCECVFQLGFPFLDTLSPCCSVLVGFRYQAVFEMFCEERSKVQRRVLNGIEIKIHQDKISLDTVRLCVCGCVGV